MANWMGWGDQKEKIDPKDQRINASERKVDSLIKVLENAHNQKKENEKGRQKEDKPQNQLQKAVEDQQSDGDSKEMQPGLSTIDVKHTKEEQAKESFLASLSKEWLQLVQKVDKLRTAQNEALKKLTTAKQSASAEKQKQVKQDKPYCIYHKNNTHAMDDCKALAHCRQQQQ
uniref:Uncharacterized protein n=1 Tax=Romanomermis culicivorax TaxID=13658 RepID=A0A915L232_ROMCU